MILIMNGNKKEMATHSSVLAWRIPGMWEPGGLPSMGSHRVGHDWSDLAAVAALSHWCLCCWPWTLSSVLKLGKPCRYAGFSLTSIWSALTYFPYSSHAHVHLCQLPSYSKLCFSWIHQALSTSWLLTSVLSACNAFLAHPLIVGSLSSRSQFKHHLLREAFLEELPDLAKIQVFQVNLDFR